MKTLTKSQIIPTVQKSKHLFYALHKKQALTISKCENKCVEKDVTVNIKCKIDKVATLI